VRSGTEPPESGSGKKFVFSMGPLPRAMASVPTSNTNRSALASGLASLYIDAGIPALLAACVKI